MTTAADELTAHDVVRRARLDSLSILLTRIANGLTLTSDEATLLIEHIGTEVSESTTARTAAAALSRKLERARGLHAQTCPHAQGAAQPPAFTCSLCTALTEPAKDSP